MNPMTLEDHQVVTAILYTATKGKLPPWAPTEEAFLDILRLPGIPGGEHALKTLHSIRAVGPSLAARGQQINLSQIVGAITGWNHGRVATAIDVAQQAGLIANGKERAAS